MKYQNTVLNPVEEQQMNLNKQCFRKIRTLHLIGVLDNNNVDSARGFFNLAEKNPCKIKKRWKYTSPC